MGLGSMRWNENKGMVLNVLGNRRELVKGIRERSMWVMGIKKIREVDKMVFWDIV